jgi:hypothetical protein
MANSENLLRRLRTTLDRPDTVLLIGSGVSLWSGLPTWGQLLIQLAEFVEGLGRDAVAVRQEIDTGDLLLAASYAVHQLDLREFGAFIRKATNYPNARPAEIHSLIASLGPSCFITTNYDRLLETAIKETGRETPAVVTNRQISEIADIIPSYARRFVFKYHGDVEDAASIILTRDQYRRIQHEYPATIRAFGTLLATRPVVMIGFGLRDLDFLAVKDELVAAFEGQVGEYYAILPDFDQLRAKYWRETYRTEIISYETIVNSDGSRDHSNLLKLIKSLQPSQLDRVAIDLPLPPQSPSEFTLCLARLAASINRKKPSAPPELLPLTVTSEPTVDGYYLHHPSDVSTLLRRFEKSMLLLGPPGSGKSFALINYAIELATTLLEQCFQEEPNPQSLHIPIFVHLAVYAGDLRNLLQETLPTGIDLTSLLGKERTTLILDGLNEIPREFIESGKWISDFHELASSTTKCRIILGSRNETWLGSLDLDRFTISDISFDFVVRHFASLGNTEIEKNPELAKTLSRPLFFSLASSNRIVLADVVTPADVYASFFGLIDASWNNNHQPIDFASALEGVAFGMLEAGAEFAAKEQFEAAFQGLGQTNEFADRALSYLVAQGALVTLAGHRLAFFHQSATEYLAAKIIARQFIDDRDSLRRRLQDKRWDQALFLAMSFLETDERSRFLDEILAADLTAAARAAHYLEVGREIVVEAIITRAAGQPQSDGLFDFEVSSRLEHQLEQLPYTKTHTKALQLLSKCQGSIGGCAAAALFKIHPDRHTKIISRILRGRDDWNYFQTFVSITGTYWTESDLRHLLEILERKKELESASVFSGLFLKRVPTTELLSWCQPYLRQSSAAKAALLEALRSFDSPAARSILINLIREGEEAAIYLLYSNLRFKSANLEERELVPDDKVVEVLLRKRSSEYGAWAIFLGRQLIEKNPDWQNTFKSATASDRRTQLFSDLISCKETDLPEVAIAAISFIDELDDSTRRILGQMDFWPSMPPAIIARALSTRDPHFVSALLGELQGQELPLLSIQPLDWWLDWEEECLRSKDQTVKWCAWRINQFLRSGDQETTVATLALFNGEPISGFVRIGRLVFNEGTTRITCDQLSPTALARLLDEGKKFEFSALVLGKTASEEFVRTTLLPHLRSNPTYTWIRKAIEIAGHRHNRRYLLDG